MYHESMQRAPLDYEVKRPARVNSAWTQLRAGLWAVVIALLAAICWLILIALLVRD
jgi:hypothetical protein